MGLFHTDLEYAQIALKKGKEQKAVMYFEKYAKKQPWFGVKAICKFALTGKYCICEPHGNYSRAWYKFYDMSAYKDYSAAAKWCRYGLQELPNTPSKYKREVPDNLYRLILAIVSESKDERMRYLSELIFRYSHSDAAYYAMCHNLVDEVCKNEQEKITLYKTVITGCSSASDDRLFDQEGRLLTPAVLYCWLYEQLNQKKQKERKADALKALAGLAHRGSKQAMNAMQEIMKGISKKEEEAFKTMFTLDKLQQDELGVHWLYDDNTEVIFNDDYTFTFKDRQE